MMSKVGEAFPSADYVIVGAGSAGSVLASRLTEDPSTRVTLIEAGGEASSLMVQMPVGFARLVANNKFDWCYEQRPDASINGRRFLWSGGKLLGWHYMFYYHQAYGFNRYLSSKGYVVLSINYRSGIGYGLNFREALNYGPAGGSEFNDVLGAGRYLRSRGDVMPDRIGLWGGSYGGYLTALGLARASDLFAAGVDLHGVHDWNDEMSNDVAADLPEKRLELARIALQSSPLAYMNTWSSPVLLIQGDDDRNVNFRQTEILVEALRKQHVPFEELIFPDETHDFLKYDTWLKAYEAAESFLSRHLFE